MVKTPAFISITTSVLSNNITVSFSTIDVVIVQKQKCFHWPRQGFIGRAKACQQSGGEGTAGKAVVVMLCDRHAVDVDDSRRGIFGVSLGHVLDSITRL